MQPFRIVLLLVGASAAFLAACGDDGVSGSDSEPTVVVTTNILGDVVESFAGDHVDVVTIMPVGADPHDFQASAQQANQIREADAVIANGAGFEEGLLDVVESAAGDGAPVFEAVSAVETIDFGAGGHDHDDGEHDDDHDDHGTEDHDETDPHLFTDPIRTAEAVDAAADFLIEQLDDVDSEALRASADDYIDQLEALDVEVRELLDGVPDERRVLVTNHDVFGYFADRYDFEIVGTIIPGGSTTDGASAGALADLAEVVESEGVPAIFVDTSSTSDLAETLSAEVGDIAVVELFSESLGEPDSGAGTYLEMVRTNAHRIADALTD